MHAVCMQRWLATSKPPAGVASHGLATCKGWPTTARPPARGGQPARGCHPLAEAAALVAGVAALWQGSCWSQRAAVAYAGAAAVATQ
ncbi:hypothetical protein GW17_00055717 [Ensete ventricosum]|nr:hypothetical protein GW17_00055717 [Ensete ventricosum]